MSSRQGLACLVRLVSSTCRYDTRRGRPRTRWITNNVRTLTGDLQTEMMDSYWQTTGVRSALNWQAGLLGDQHLLNGQLKAEEGDVKRVHERGPPRHLRSGLAEQNYNAASFDELVTLKQALQQAGYERGQATGGERLKSIRHDPEDV